MQGDTLLSQVNHIYNPEAMEVSWNHRFLLDGKSTLQLSFASIFTGELDKKNVGSLSS